jgi:hypothetical protein
VSDWGDIAYSLLCATALAVIWPIFALYQVACRCAVGRSPEAAARFIGGESKSDKLRRLEMQEVERKRYVHQLESEVGIQQDKQTTTVA